MRPWNIFFALITITIVTAMVTPHVFGLQNFTQWGGMYTDGWCSAYSYAHSADGQVKEENLTAPSTRSTWSSPMHNDETCLAWGQSWCGVERERGFTIDFVKPYFRQEYMLGDDGNVCDLAILDPPWFLHK